MKTSILTEMQKSDQVVHVVKSDDADPLITAGYVRRATITPRPKKGQIAVNLTVLGRSFRQPAKGPQRTSKGSVSTPDDAKIAQLSPTTPDQQPFSKID